MKTILELADDYAKAYFMGRGEEARKGLQAALMRQELQIFNLERGLQEAMATAPAMSDQLREEYASGLDSPTPDEREEI